LLLSSSEQVNTLTNPLRGWLTAPIAYRADRIAARLTITVSPSPPAEVLPWKTPVVIKAYWTAHGRALRDRTQFQLDVLARQFHAPGRPGSPGIKACCRNLHRRVISSPITCDGDLASSRGDCTWRELLHPWATRSQLDRVYHRNQWILDAASPSRHQPPSRSHTGALERVARQTPLHHHRCRLAIDVTHPPLDRTYQPWGPTDRHRAGS